MGKNNRKLKILYNSDINKTLVLTETKHTLVLTETVETGRRVSHFHMFQVLNRRIRYEVHNSSDDRTFRIPTFKRKQHGGWAFCFSAAQTWNSLPFVVRHSPSLPAFKTNLKTHLFRQYFD